MNFLQTQDFKKEQKAEEQLCISQPSLSHAIAQLEKELGSAV
ncbi:MAG: LysR family transcriptional regulator [Mediterraneibacter gnavus]